MDWEIVKIVISIASLIISLLTLCGFGVFMSLNTKKRFDKRQAEEARVQAALKKQEQDELMELFNKALDAKLTPIAQDVASIKSNLALNTEGTVTILRNDMKKSLDFCKERGFANTSDKANWKELYNTYDKLGGNHFKEYVNGWKQEMEDLPPKKKTRQKLNEKK